MYIIDSHTHLFDKAFDDDRDDVVAQCVLSGVQKMVLPCCSPRSLVGIEYLCGNYPENCFPTLGLHPEDMDDDPDAQLEKIFSTEFSSPIVAVGEIGIDLHYLKDNLELQKRIFDIQIRKAIELDLPIIIHCREAYNEVFDVLEPYRGKVRGIFHCFCGNADEAKRVLDFGGFHFGIGGVVTFKSSGATVAQIVKDIIPMDRIVLETDAPYLAPVPHRGKRNDSSLLRFVAHKIAELKGIDVEDVIRITTDNSEKIFGI